MTVIAISAAGDVRRVLACGYYAVMAGAAGTEYLCMVYRVNRHPDIRVMAVFTNISRLNVREIFTGGFDAVVATDAITNDVCMIEIGG